MLSNNVTCLTKILFTFLANAAAFAAGILFYITFVPIYFLNGKRYELMSRSEKMSAGLLSNCAMSFGVMSIMIYEGTGKCLIVVYVPL